MLTKVFILKFLILNAESKTIIIANEKNFPSFVSLTDGKEPLKNKRQTAPPLNHLVIITTFWLSFHNTLYWAV